MTRDRASLASAASAIRRRLQLSVHLAKNRHSGNRLTVSGKREAEKQSRRTYYSYERSYGDFTRSFTLPDGVDMNGYTRT